MAVFFDASPDVVTPEVLAGLGDDQLWQVIYDNLHPGKDPPGRCFRPGRSPRRSWTNRLPPASSLARVVAGAECPSTRLRLARANRPPQVEGSTESG